MPAQRRTVAQAVSAPAAAASASGTPGIPIDSGRELTTTGGYTANGYTTQVVIADTATGTQIGDPVVLTGRLVKDPVLAADGKHVLIATSDNYATPYTGQVAVFDTTTGAQTGNTLTFAGVVADLALIGTAGRVVVTNFQYNAATGTGTTQFTVIDANTGGKVGPGLALDGSPWDTSIVSTDGTHALVMTTVLDEGNKPIATNLAVLDTTDGTAAGTAHTLDGGLSGDPLVSADGVHVLITANDDPWHLRPDSHTQILVVDATTGQQAGTTLTLDGHTLLGPVFNADGIHALFVAGAGGTTQVAVVDTSTSGQPGVITLAGTASYTYTAPDRAHVLVTTTDGAAIRTAVIDTATGDQTSSAAIALAGPIGYTFTDDDEAHALFTTTDGESTHIAVVDIATGQQTGTTLTLAGAMAKVVANINDGHVLVATTDGDSTHVMVVDGTTGTQTGTIVTVTGELSSLEWPQTTADGTRVILLVHSPLDPIDNWTRVVVIDTVTGTQAGTTVGLPGWVYGPYLSPDGSRATFAASVPASDKHGSSTHFAVIDTTTGNQVGTTIRVKGRPRDLPQVSADGYHVIVETAAGFQVKVNSTTGEAAVTLTGPPWGLDTEAFLLTPIGRVLSAISAAVAQVQIIVGSILFWGAVFLGSIFAH